jgi:molybdopterin/thiamine biosynthesis adenylyltransferase
MMTGLRLTAGDYETLARSLLDDSSTERCAIGLAHHDASGSWVLAAAVAVPDDAYAHRDAISASLKPEQLVAIANRARASGMSPIIIHTHPHAGGAPRFSPIDDNGEAEMKAYFDRRAPEARPLAVVIGPEGCSARELGLGNPVPVWKVGSSLWLMSDSGIGGMASGRHDRQVRAFGEIGQRIVSMLRILVIGAGGTGSATVQQLAYLGALDLTIVDPDNVDETNLNRLIGAGPADVGAPKVEVARRMARLINPEARVDAIVRDIVDEEATAIVADFDFVFLCTDSHASRAVAGQAAYQFLVPTIDMGVSITVAGGAITHVTGRVQMLAPGLPCLSCTRALDASQIRQEMLTPEQRAADPYVLGQHEPQPAVVSLNTTMASLAVTMFLGAVTPVPAQARFQLYDGMRGTVRPTTASLQHKCIVCSREGALARGWSWPLPVRPKAVLCG